jgi:CBS domain containing-hemolysin-like protein
MTPRREVDMVDLSADPDDIRRTIVESVHSRLPAHAGTPEEMLGIIQAKDLLDAYLRDQRPDIRAHWPSGTMRIGHRRTVSRVAVQHGWGFNLSTQSVEAHRRESWLWPPPMKVLCPHAAYAVRGS